jgi:hypothetical protein
MDSVRTINELLRNLAAFFRLLMRSRASLAAENLFLRKQLAMFQEREAKPRRPVTPIRIMLTLLSKFFNWRDALVVVQPQTLIRWHRQGFRLFWRWKSRPGRPPIPVELRQLIRNMAKSNATWGGKDALPMNCCSSWVFASLHARYENICPNTHQDARAATSAGRPLFAITPQPFWPVISVS